MKYTIKKKKQKKGFTLVELLAVIIILAIVVGIAIPSVNAVINKSKLNSLGVTVENAANYLAEQYNLYNVDQASVTISDDLMSSILSAYAIRDRGEGINIAYAAKELGFKEKINNLRLDFTVDGYICIDILQIPLDSEYYTPKYWMSYTLDGVEGYAPNRATNDKAYYCK